MKDPKFIDERLFRGQQAKKKAEDNFFNLTREQLNWRPSVDTWSIAQCLEHLVITKRLYFDDLQAIASGTYQMTLWEKHNPLSGLLGKVLRNQMKEQVNRKLAAPQILIPASSAYELHLLNAYLDNLTGFIDLVFKCRDAELDKCIINSPMITWVTYSLRDALEFLFEHEHRHLNQAIRLQELRTEHDQP